MKTTSFIDEVEIKVKPGSGGDGSISFLREKNRPKGGPSGGNGGSGGSVYFYADHNLDTLLHFRGKREYRAEDGEPGSRNNRTGKSGLDLFIAVPIGTEIIFKDKKVAELLFDKQVYLFSKGKRGGRGNASFKNSTNKAPLSYEVGEKGEWQSLQLNLKILADVGLLGFPSVGKSTFLATISNAHPKIADYPFTTLRPHLGLVERYHKTFVIADIPGLIEGAHQNKGMGIEFLKHLMRTKVILHFLESTDPKPYDKYLILRKELMFYSKKLVKKPEIIVFTKIDLLGNLEREQLSKKFKKKKVLFLSSHTKEGIEKLLQEILSILDREKSQKLEKINSEDDSYVEINLESIKTDDQQYQIFKHGDKNWELKGEYFRYWSSRIPLTNDDNFLRFWKILERKGIIKELKRKGIKINDIITVENTSFIFGYFQKNTKIQN